MRGKKSGWEFSGRVDGVVVAEGSDSTVLTLYSKQTEIKASNLSIIFSQTSSLQKHCVCFRFSPYLRVSQRRTVTFILNHPDQLQPGQ